jgi:hypothetical protein
MSSGNADHDAVLSEIFQRPIGDGVQPDAAAEPAPREEDPVLLALEARAVRAAEAADYPAALALFNEVCALSVPQRAVSLATQTKPLQLLELSPDRASTLNNRAQLYQLMDKRDAAKQVRATHQSGF